MLNLTIDNIKVEAQEHETILAVARREGIQIPTLCYHAKLGPCGACRICLVEVEPGNRLVASCITKVLNNMVVKTDSPMALKARKTNLELLLARHPADCLVCEQGGECELQDVSFMIGTAGRFTGEQNRIVKIFGVQPLDLTIDDTRTIIERDLNKCILCKRCIRICHEIQGVGAINFSNRAYKMELGAFYGRALDCEFCGQCVDICPVGALLNKLPKYRARVWQLTPVKSTCTYCGCGCTLILNVKDNELIKISTRDEVGVNNGNLCARGRYGFDFVGSRERLRSPLIKEDGEFREAGWNEALTYTADRLKEIKERSGAESIAAFGSARCTNEDNYLLQKVMRAAIGTPNLDSSVRLEHAPALEALTNSLGWPAATNSIGDLANSKAILVVEANITENHPIIGLQIKAAVRKHKARLLLIETEQTKLESLAEITLHPRLGTEVALLNGLAQVLIEEKLLNKDFIARQTEGYQELAAALKKYTPVYVEKITGVPAEQIKAAAKLYGETQPASSFFGTGLSQRLQGKEAAAALVNLAQLCGNIGVPGGGVNPLRVQNNVQGSCDMGMLPDYLPGYQPVGDEQARARLEELWGVKLPAEPGLNINEVFAIGKKSKIKALYVVGENPLLAFPQKKQVKAVLEKLDLLVVQDIFLTETAQMADVVLPGVSFAEADGTFTNTERRVQRVRQAISPLADCRPSWRILADLSRHLGYNMPSYQSAAQVMEEIAQAVPLYGGISYRRLEQGGIQWPCPEREHPGTAVLYQEGFPRGKARFQVVDYQPMPEESREYPYLVTVGKYHSGTMSRYSQALLEIRMG